MSFEAEINDDCLLIDGCETVTLHGASTVVVAGAKRGQLTMPEIEFRQVALEPVDLAWSLPDVSLEGVTPDRGNSIEDAAGVFWNIQSVQQSPLTGVWRAVTRRQW